MELECRGACHCATSHSPAAPSGTSPAAFALAYSTIFLLEPPDVLGSPHVLPIHHVRQLLNLQVGLSRVRKADRLLS